jgi:hypothetical protein
MLVRYFGFGFPLHNFAETTDGKTLPPGVSICYTEHS